MIPETYLEFPGESGRYFPSNIPFLSPEARVVAEDGFSFAHILDSSSGRYIQHGLQIFPNRDEFGGYPIHEGCWRILNALLEVSDVLLHDRMSTFYKILDNTSYLTFGCKLLWPHRYHGLSDERSQPAMWIPTPELKYVESDPWVMNDIPTLLKTSWIKRQDRQFLFVPRILPLPVELVQRIYSYLDWSDMANLLLLKTAVNIKVPTSYWRSLLLPGAEFGYLYLDETQKINQGLSSFQKFCIARMQQVKESDVIKNRRRIWKICNALADQIIDISSCDSQGLDPVDPVSGFDTIPDTSPPTPSCWVQSEGYTYHGTEANSRTFLGSKAIYQGEIDVDSIEALILSYTGSGSMSFLSGITVLPSGKQIGYITDRTRLVPWVEKTVLSVAVSTYGIVDISLSHAVDEPNWMLVEKDFRERQVAVRYRLLGNTVDGVKIRGRWDASKMIEIRLSTSQILDDQSLTSEAETFLQKHAWTPGIPPLQLDINTQSYSGAPYTWSGAPRYCPLQFVLFPSSSLLTLITGWSSSNRISALTFHFKGHSPVTLGEPQGTPSDFLINGEAGEEIASMHALLHKDHRDSLCGIVLETNTGRKALFGIEKLNNCYSRPLFSPQGPRLKGLYGVSRRFRLDTCDLSSIGVITYPRTNGEIEVTPPPLNWGSLGVENAIFVDHTSSEHIRIQNQTQYGDYHYLRRSLHVGPIKQFANTATLKDCRRIIFYKKSYHGKSRIVGMKLYYKQDVRECGNPRILGRISDGIQESRVLELPEDGSSFIRRLLVHVREPPSEPIRGNTYMCGLTVQLSDGESMLWGSNNIQTAPKYLPLKRESTLRWDYNERFDIISVIEEKERIRSGRLLQAVQLDSL